MAADKGQKPSDAEKHVRTLTTAVGSKDKRHNTAAVLERARRNRADETKKGGR